MTAQVLDYSYLTLRILKMTTIVNRLFPPRPADSTVRQVLREAPQVAETKDIYCGERHQHQLSDLSNS